MFELFCILAVFAFLAGIPAVMVAIPTFVDHGSQRYARAMYRTDNPRAYRAIMARRDSQGRFVRP